MDSTSNSADNDLQRHDLSTQQSISDITNWIENEAEFYGRNDHDFVLMFLRSCNFNLKLTQKTLTYYYENRRNIPQWFTNRNLDDQKLRSILYDKTSIAITEIDDRTPTIVITSLSRIVNGLNTFDDQFRVAAIIMESVMRRKNTQMNGAAWLVDAHNYSWWFLARCMNPLFVKNFVYAFHFSVPVKVQAIVVINAPSNASMIINLIKPYLDEELRKRIYVYGTDWQPAIYEHISKDVLPKEFDGNNGTLDEHANALIREVLANNDYLIEDSKYGFQ